MDNYISYGKMAKFLHWTMAALILLNYGLGLTLEQTSLFNLHKQIGLSILMMALLRLSWRLVEHYPAQVASLTPLERIGAKLSHIALYCFMLAVPLSGIIMVNSFGRSLDFLGLVPLPALINRQSDHIAHFSAEIHEILANGMIAIIAVHGLAAIKHHLMDKNEVLLRMLPFSRRRD